MSSSDFSRKTGLALGGGAILGAAHIGVLKALDEAEFRIDCVSGTSIGAFIAALYACGVNPDDIETVVTDLHWLDISDFTMSRFGLLSNEKLGSMIKEVTGCDHFDDTQRSLAIVATDIGSFEKIIIKEGSIATAVMASASVPGIFTPVEIDSRMLVDGGLVENVPLSPLADMGAEFTIGVDLNAGRKYQKPDDFIDVLVNALDIAVDNTTRIQTRCADILIAPELSAYSRTDTDMVHEMIEEGYIAACRILGETSR